MPLASFIFEFCDSYNNIGKLQSEEYKNPKMRSLKLKMSVKAAMLGAAVEVMAAIVVIMMAFLLVGCTRDEGSKNHNITIITREDGSGTRRAFVELTGILKGKQDRTTVQAEVTNSNFVVMMSVAGDKNAIGYVSLGTLCNRIENVRDEKDIEGVKAVKIDGVEANVQNLKEGKYSLARKFYVVVRDDLSRTGRDFIDYILSDEGQEMIEQQGYIGERTGNTYKTVELEGKVTLAGSTSVAPVLEVLAEKYKKYNPDVIFEIQQTGSFAGIESVTKGVCDIGMSSRDLYDSERTEGLTEIKIATDGIAVIVNKENELNDISKENIAEIYMGNITSWDDVKQ